MSTPRCTPPPRRWTCDGLFGIVVGVQVRSRHRGREPETSHRTAGVSGANTQHGLTQAPPSTILKGTAMIHLTFYLTAAVYYWLQAHAPTNRWIARLRANPTLKGCAASLVLGLTCLVAAGTLSTLITHGWPGWLNLLVLLLGFDGIKLALLAPAGVVWLVRSRVARARA